MWARPHLFLEFCGISAEIDACLAACYTGVQSHVQNIALNRAGICEETMSRVSSFTSSHGFLSQRAYSPFISTGLGPTSAGCADVVGPNKSLAQGGCHVSQTIEMAIVVHDCAGDCDAGRLCTRSATRQAGRRAGQPVLLEHAFRHTGGVAGVRRYNGRRT